MMRAAVVTILVCGVACGSATASSPPGRTCRNAETLYLSETATTGPLGAFSGKYVGQLQLTNKILASTLEIRDEQLRADVDAVATHLTKGNLATPRFLAALLQTCRLKGYLAGP